MTMVCPHCRRKLTLVDVARTRCQQCGRRLDRAALGLVRTSSVRVAAGDSDQVFQSVEDLPPSLRRQLQQAISGPDAETIVIADERGREQLFQVINGLPPQVQKKVLASIRLAAPPSSPIKQVTLRRLLLLLAGLAVLALLLFWVWK